MCIRDSDPGDEHELCTSVLDATVAAIGGQARPGQRRMVEAVTGAMAADDALLVQEMCIRDRSWGVSLRFERLFAYCE